MASEDQTKELLQEILAGLYKEQAKEVASPHSGAFLIAGDNQFLGRLDGPSYQQDFLLNEYGPYGSHFSATSIFNQYSQYGSVYGQYSIQNPYCTTPPWLYLNGVKSRYVSTNQLLSPRVSADEFLYTIRNDLQAALQGEFSASEADARARRNESFIVADDGAFLGSLTPNTFDQNTIHNQYGPYGNRFSQLSIFNRFGNYGSQFAQLSPYNRFSQTPPRVFVGGTFKAFLTKNQMKTPRIDPDDIVQWSNSNVPKWGGST